MRCLRHVWLSVWRERYRAIVATPAPPMTHAEQIADLHRFREMPRWRRDLHRAMMRALTEETTP